MIRVFSGVGFLCGFRIGREGLVWSYMKFFLWLFWFLKGFFVEVGALEVKSRVISGYR